MNEWIDVNTRFPDHNSMVMVWYEPTKADGTGRNYEAKGWRGMAFVADDHRWTRGDGNLANDVFGSITHWIPLPAPPTQKAGK